jgi:hypothetical protein
MKLCKLIAIVALAVSSLFVAFCVLVAAAWVSGWLS